MMNPRISIVAVFMVIITSLLVACNDKPAVASPACVDIEKVTDSAQKAELLKKCPRSGPAFKPSEEKKW